MVCGFSTIMLTPCRIICSMLIIIAMMVLYLLLVSLLHSLVKLYNKPTKSIKLIRYHKVIDPSPLIYR